MIASLSLRLALGLGCLGLARPAHGQIYGVWFKTENDARPYRKHLTRFRGEQVLIGEPKAGVTHDEAAQKIHYSNGANEFFVADPGDPSAVPYQWKNGERTTRGGKGVVSVTGTSIQKIQVIDRDNSLLGLAREYQFRLASLDVLRKERDAFGKGDAAWFTAHGRLLSALERLQQWLENTMFPDAAERVLKEIAKERKLAARDAAQQRLKTALDTIGRHRELTDVGGVDAAGAKFFDVQSRHVRITYCHLLSHDRVRELMVLAEKLIDGFQRDMIDPFLGDDYADTLPGGLVTEFYFGPDVTTLHEAFLVNHYKLAWSSDPEDKNRKLNSPGNRFRFSTGDKRFLDYWRIKESQDPEGIVAHGLGHALSGWHYHRGRLGGSQPWLDEGVGYHLSFGYLGRNSVTCFEHRKADYAHNPGPEGEKTVDFGQRAAFNGLALLRGPSLDVLAMKTLFAMKDEDLAKAWSLYDWVATTQGKRGQQWLRAACDASGQGFLGKWRASSERIFGVAGEDVFQRVDDLWRDYAERTQPNAGRSP